MIKDERVYILENALFEANEETELSKTIVSPNWLQLISPDADHSSANAVFRSILSPEELEKQIDEVKLLYQKIGVKFRWYVTPLTKPGNTAKVLEEKGFKLYSICEAMIMETDKMLAAGSSATSISVREVKKPELETYVNTVAKAWGAPDKQKEVISKFIGNAMDKERRFHAFVAFLDGEPVGTSLLISISSGGYLAAGAVVPEHRGKGVYRAMVCARAKLADQLGHKHLLIHANKATSAPVCRKLGFEWVFDYESYEFSH